MFDKFDEFENLPESTNLKLVNPCQKFNIGSLNHLMQIQHKSGHIDIVDYME